MSWLSDLFKGPKKVNLTPDITPQMPSQINPEMYGSLSSLAKRYINNEGTGFGDNFVSKATNPAIAQIDANFNQRTLPTISNEASKRGIARSSIVTDQIASADQQRNRDIDSLVADFFKLNEMQKKSDQQFGVNLGQNILSGDVNAQANQAAASERLANATAADARTREALQRQQTGQMLELGSMALPGLSAATGGGIASILRSLGMGNVANTLKPLGESINNFAQGASDITKVKLTNDEDKNAFFSAFMKTPAGRKTIMDMMAKGVF